MLHLSIFKHLTVILCLPLLLRTKRKLCGRPRLYSVSGVHDGLVVAVNREVGVQISTRPPPLANSAIMSTLIDRTLSVVILDGEGENWPPALTGRD